jgi:hypothetical protein
MDNQQQNNRPGTNYPYIVKHMYLCKHAPYYELISLNGWLFTGETAPRLKHDFSMDPKELDPNIKVFFTRVEERCPTCSFHEEAEYTTDRVKKGESDMEKEKGKEKKERKDGFTKALDDYKKVMGK